MRQQRTSAALVAAAAFLLWSGVGGAAPLNWSGTATVMIYRGDQSAVFVGGGVATVNGTSGVVPDHLDTIRLADDRGLVRGSYTHYVTDPETAGFGLAAIQYLDVHGMTGTIGGSFEEGRYPGALPVRGIVRVCLLSSACTCYVPMNLTRPTTVNGAPGSGIQGLGVGGILTIGGFGGIRISVQLAPWTVKTVTGLGAVETPQGGVVNSIWTTAGWAHGAQSSTSSTAAPGGGIKLVTPAQITTNMPIGFGHPDGRLAGTVGSVIALTLHFVPEPGLVGGLGAALCGLALIVQFRRLL